MWACSFLVVCALKFQTIDEVVSSSPFNSVYSIRLRYTLFITGSAVRVALYSVGTTIQWHWLLITVSTSYRILHPACVLTHSLLLLLTLVLCKVIWIRQLFVSTLVSTFHYITYFNATSIQPLPPWRLSPSNTFPESSLQNDWKHVTSCAVLKNAARPVTRGGAVVL